MLMEALLGLRSLVLWEFGLGLQGLGFRALGLKPRQTLNLQQAERRQRSD